MSVSTENGESTGSGDWPVPSVGPWYINQTTVVNNETIYIEGSLIIQDNLTLNNCTVRFNQTGDDQYNISMNNNGSFTGFDSVFTDNSSSYSMAFSSFHNHTYFVNVTFLNFTYMTFITGEFTIIDSLFDGISSYFQLIDFWPADIHNNRWVNGSGVHLGGSAAGQPVEYALTFKDNTINTGSGVGLTLQNMNFDVAHEPIDVSHNVVYGSNYGLIFDMIHGLEIENNTFAGSTDDAVIIDSLNCNISYSSFGGGSGSVKLQYSHGIILWNSYHESREIISSQYQVFWLVNMTFRDLDFFPLAGASVAIYDVYGSPVLARSTNPQGKISYHFLQNENGTDYNTFQILISALGNTAYRTLDVYSEMNVTFVITEFRVFKVVFHVQFFNLFDGYGLDEHLLRIFYRVDAGSWIRAPPTFQVNYSSGMSIDIRVCDYWNFTISERSISSPNAETFIDFSIPLATVQIENDQGFDLKEFTITRYGSGSTMQIYGTEFRVIADITGNSTLVYRIAWDNTTVRDPLNGSTFMIDGGNHTFTAETTEGNPHIIQNLTGQIEGKWILDPEKVKGTLEQIAETEWYRKAVVIVILLGFLLWIYRAGKVAGEQLEKRTESENNG